MPEGDTIYRTAATLRPALEGGVIADARFATGSSSRERLVGRHGDERRSPRQAPADAPVDRRRHPLAHGHDRLVAHLPPRRAVAEADALRGAASSAINELDVICFSPKLLELLTADQLRRHPHLQRLGPDLLAADSTCPAAVARFRARNAVPLGEAVMNQTIVCGIGNVYKSDLLFLMGFDPFAPVERVQRR